MWIIKSETPLKRDEYERIAEQMMNQRGSYVMLPAGVSVAMAPCTSAPDSPIVTERCDYCGSGRTGIENCKNCGAPRPTPAYRNSRSGRK